MWSAAALIDHHGGRLETPVAQITACDQAFFDLPD